MKNQILILALVAAVLSVAFVGMTQEPVAVPSRSAGRAQLESLKRAKEMKKDDKTIAVLRKSLENNLETVSVDIPTTVTMSFSVASIDGKIRVIEDQITKLTEQKESLLELRTRVVQSVEDLVKKETEEEIKFE